MEDDVADVDTMWPLQDDSFLTLDATSYVDDYLQAIESELCSDSALLCADAPFPDLYGATVNWEPMIQRKYAPATQTEQMSSSPYAYTAPAAVADQFCLSVADTGPAGRHAPWTDGKANATNGSLSTTAGTLSLCGNIPEPRFETPDCLASLSQWTSEELSDKAGNEREVWISPQDLVLSNRANPGSMQAREKHGKDVLRRYARAEQEIASLSRRALHSTVSTTGRRRNARRKHVRVNHRDCRIR
ncbi:hypothetical protein AA0119_g13503 [Alternaria tenuissima]|uniref:BZIP domain-containing protein n=2 Tax=Alternaria tenuissima TaxID=119927 RepID=A0ABY0FNG6_9PLEO|nr:hypothetical protein AA0119_g13503 [Alternaria tenuissima]RYN97667.1 hypothetical protein AA0121_g13516 [Alternaria tenuissima]RYO48228.1 hypothetical protein AA0116_g12612 [Alternaria tenuissima]